MKYLVVIFERMVNGETGELLSSSKREVGIFDSKQKAKKMDTESSHESCRKRSGLRHVYL